MVIADGCLVDFILPVCICVPHIVDNTGVTGKLFPDGFAVFVGIEDVDFAFPPADTKLAGIIDPERLSFFPFWW